MTPEESYGPPVAAVSPGNQTLAGAVRAGLYGLVAGIAAAGLLLAVDSDPARAWLAVAAALLTVFAVCAPSRWVLLAFVLFMLGTHQFRSFFTVPLGGVEWHPREFALFLLLLHWGTSLLRGQAPLPRGPVAVSMLFYGAFFVYGACRGILAGHGFSAVVAESRFPLFLLAFLPFAGCLANRNDLWFLVKGILVAVSAIAGGGLVFFAYTEVSGNIVNVQNSLGEYVRRDCGGRLIQSVRPNGHALFEFTLVVLCGLLFVRGTGWPRRALYGALIALFLGAILLTMMRTAYVSVAIGLAVLTWLHLPRRQQAVSAVAAVLGGSGLAILTLGFLRARAQGATESLEVSLRSRFVEMAGAWDLFAAAPVIGSGFGSTFTAPGLVATRTLLSVREVSFQTIHNVWMYFLYKGGIIGIGLVALGLGGLLLSGVALAGRLRDDRERHFVLGITAAFAGQLVASAAMPRLTYPSGAVMVALLAAVLVVLSRPRTT